MQQTKLKNELFTNLKDIGLQDELKKHLRIQLCQKLKQKDLIKKNDTHQNKLYNRIMASLISEQLKLTDCGYANSIYVAQSGYDEKVLQREELIQIMNINPHDLEQQYSILSNLIKRKYPFNGGTVRNISIQTNPEEVGYTLEQRLSKIDQQYRNNVVNFKQNDPVSFYQGKIKQYEQEIKRNYDRDLERFKEFQAHSIKVKISQQWRQRYEDYSKNIENDYRRKLQALRKKQKLFEDQMVGRQKNLNQKATNLEKTLKEKIELLDMKNMTVEEHLKHLESEKKRMKEDSAKEHKELKVKIREYDDLLLNVNKKIQYEVNVAKLAMQQEYQEKEVEFLNKKKFIDEEYGKLMGIKDTTDIIKEENKRLFDENTRLRKDLTTLQQQLRIAVSQNGSKGDRIQNLKQQILELKENNKRFREKQVEGDKKRKNIEKQIINLRKQVENLRNFKEEHTKKEDSFSENERNKNNIEGGRNNLDLKLEQLKQERKKQIERLKMDL